MKKEDLKSPKLIASTFLCIAATVALVFLIMLGVRWFNQATIQTKVIQPKYGVECVVVSTTDGASVDCWKTE